ncbi:MAG: carboxymuconolactone decarboxylase family protein [Nitrososphaerota archaeon]|nr:carboxymuconolactone decarboxylase family protein [Nitrososphaerota archaeon]
MPIVNVLSREELEKLFQNKDSETYQYVKMLSDAPYVRALGHKPKILENMALSSKHGNPTRLLPRKVKEMIASAISMFNNCEYCITSHTGILKGLYRLTDEELVELACVVGHINGLDFLEKTASLGLILSSECVDEGLLSEVRDDFGEIPGFMKMLCHDPELFRIIWDREKVTMQEGKIDRGVKDLIAFYISASNSCTDNARVRLRRVEQSGIKIEAVLEGISVAERFHKNTKITSGLLLETTTDELLVMREHKDQL